MTEFDIDQFEQRLKALVDAHECLKVDYCSLQTAFEAEKEKNEHMRQRLDRVIERIGALETEAQQTDRDNG